MTGRSGSSCSSEFSSDFYGDSAGPEKTPENIDGCTVPAKRKGEPLEEVRVDKKGRVDQNASGFSANTLSPCAGLPAEIWQSIFLYLRPEALGRLLQVNRAFNSYLKEARFGHHRQHNPGRLHIVNSESIWSSARRWLDPRMPKPLAACSEQDMWRLLKGRDCQFCGKVGWSNTGTSNKWESGPGRDGVRIIWQFAIRSCAKCFEARSEKESSLLFSTMSALLPALPYAFVSPGMHVIAATTVQESAPPPNLRIDKWFYKGHIEDMKRQLDRARSLGQCAAEEWFKGLETVGKERLANAARWERWEATGGLNGLLHKSTARVATRGSSEASVYEPEVHVCGPQSGSIRETERVSLQPFQPLPQRPAVLIHQSLANPSLQQGSPGQPRIERNVHDANEGKAARRADIEQRCRSFIPPIIPNVLRHMESFQAAIQISRPMTDDAWALLKPRLLAQRADAERTERNLAVRTPLLQSGPEDWHHRDTSTKEVKEVLDREYESAQKSIRTQLGAYADTLIRTNWACGSSVTKETCSKFAAEVLLYVRKQFYSDLAGEDEAMQVSEDETRPKSANGPASRRLHLENMKWVFDNKIKPITERYRRELFLCNGDTCEGNLKLYGFEGVIQHYGSKHTNSFGVGNSTVRWQSAEWPEEPPFHPDPEGFITGLRVGSAAKSRGQGTFSHRPYNILKQGGYSRGTSATPQMAGQGPFTFPQPSPGPYSHVQYSSHANGPSLPPPTTVGGFPGSVTAYAGPLPPHVQFAQHTLPVQSSPQNSYLTLPQAFPAYSSYPPQAPVAWSPSQSSPRYQMSSNPYHSVPYPLPGTAPPVLDNDELVFVHSSSGQDSGLTPVVHPQRLDLPKGQMLYHEQVGGIVALIDYFWTKISRIASIPDSVKVYVVLHHVVPNFTARFHNEPSLDLFQDALASRPRQWTLNSVRQIACKLCASSISEHNTAQYSRAGPVVGELLPDIRALISHFKSVHLTYSAPAAFPQAGLSPSFPDWTKDMIALPHENAIADLIWGPVVDDDSSAIIAEAFLDLYPRPALRTGFIQPDLPGRHTRTNDEPLSSATGHGSGNFSRSLAKEERNGLSGHSQAADGPLHSLSNGLRALPHDVLVSVSPGPDKIHGDGYDPYCPTMETSVEHPLRPHQRRRSPHLDELHNSLCYVKPRRWVPPDSWQTDHGPYSHKFSRRVDPHIYSQNQAMVFRHDGSGDPSQRDSKVEGQERASSRSSPECVALLPKATDHFPHNDKFYDPEEGEYVRRVKAGEVAAEHFLHGFQPLESTTAYDTGILSGRTGPRAGTEARLIFDKSATKGSRNPSHMPTDLTAPPDNGLNGMMGPSSMQATPALPATGDSASSTPGDSQAHRPIYSRAVRLDMEYSHEMLHPEGRLYEPVSREPSRPVSVYQDRHAPGYRMVRTRSRYERYEAQRRRLAREKSRSPHKREHVEVGRRHQQDCSPPGAARQNIDRLPPQHIPMDEGGSFPSDLTTVQYRYASPLPPSYVDEYGEPVEFVRVREPYSTRAYFKDHLKSGECVEYVPYERVTPSQTAYEDRSHVYHSERRTQDGSEPILVPRAREMQQDT